VKDDRKRLKLIQIWHGYQFIMTILGEPTYL